MRARINSWTDTPFSFARWLSSKYTCESSDCINLDLTIRDSAAGVGVEAIWLIKLPAD